MTGNLEFYEAFAAEYPVFYDLPEAQEAVDRWTAILVQEGLWPNRPIAMLDLGCGPATHLACWAGAVERADGLDSSAAMLRAARESLEAAGWGAVRLYCADATAPHTLEPLRSGYDLVIAHFNFPNLFDVVALDRVAESVAMLLKTDGIFVCDVLLSRPGADTKVRVDLPEEYQGERWTSRGVRYDGATRTMRRDWTCSGAGYCETLRLHTLVELDAAMSSKGLIRRMLYELPHPSIATEVSVELSRRLVAYSRPITA